jgi:hypothetical protein
MTIIDVLYVAVSLERSEEQAGHRDRIREAIQRKRIGAAGTDAM